MIAFAAPDNAQSLQERAALTERLFFGLAIALRVFAFPRRDCRVIRCTVIRAVTKKKGKVMKHLALDCAPLLRVRGGRD